MRHKILVVDDEPAARLGLRRVLAALSCEVVEAEDGTAALEEIARGGPDLVICDIQMPGVDGLTLVKRLAEQGNPPPVIMMTAYGSERIAVDAMKAGAYDYVSKPYDVDELRCLVQNVLETVRLRRENETLRDEIRRHSGFGSLIGRSLAMDRVCDMIGKVAGTDAAVLINGESGTGKELVARAIHEQGGRKDRPFVAVNAAALPTELIESELFGHEKGAFTGAASRRQGKFELADGGTLFLDEIGDMHLETQAKLLRVLQEQRFERLGGSETVAVDVRMISATNRDLPDEISGGRFREDLYYRLKVVDIFLPPLRDRREDIPLLVRHYLDSCNRTHGKAVTEVPVDTMKNLAAYAWPGNIRELMHAVERAVIFAEGSVLSGDLLPDEVRAGGAESAAGGATGWREGVFFQEAKQESVQAFEAAFIRSALEHHKGNMSRAAPAIGMKRQALQQKVRELGIDPSIYR
ncbi:MAG: sigma-54 dependent transcriptional regulator [Gemmatimonadetes bacterium]|nr:sigma-54 dependent transcriptional regulator [Gemmatimonadota bacterium]MDE3260095.1 sigma-54 dependent transcriptional regulator [Gemmatimonadota bacterium]